MATSQFTIYSSADLNGPGMLTGTSGTLLRIFNYCLVSGYSGKTAAGWTKPFADSGNKGCFQNSGSQSILYINDNVPVVQNEATACGWETISALTAPVGTGTGQFPLPAQSLTNGHVTIRKSGDTTTGRPWVMFADQYTAYFFVLSEVASAPGNYATFWFGDIYALAGTADPSRCVILGALTDNSYTAGNGGGYNWDYMAYIPGSTVVPGMWARRPWTGVGGSTVIQKCGDSTLSALATNPPIMTGILNCPNAPDGGAVLAPIRLFETPYTNLRGRLRGLYYVAHIPGMFADGQKVNGMNEYAGKQFWIVKQGPNGGFIAVEISNTVETN